jgi:hypothetical protein
MKIFKVFDIPPPHPPANAGLYWKTRWSLTKCHVQTVMININCLGRRMYQPVLQTFLYFALKRCFMSSAVSCFWRAMYIQCSLHAGCKVHSCTSSSFLWPLVQWKSIEKWPAMMDLAPCPEVNRGRYNEAFDFACPVTLFLAYLAVTLNKFKFSE